MQGARGAIIDATIIPSAARPRQHVEDEQGQAKIVDSTDAQARWVKKGKQAFGTMKRRFHLSRTRYFGVAKVQAQMCWAALGMSLLKAHRKFKSMEMAGAGSP